MNNTPINYIRIDGHTNNIPAIQAVLSDFNKCKTACDNYPSCANFTFNPTTQNC